MKNIKFTIAIVTYNSSKIIEELLFSIYNQTYNNIEVVVVDGKSSDNTVEIIKKWLKPSDLLVSEKDRGIYDAMNKALRLANGDYLIFMGSDDHFLSFRVLEEVAKAIYESKTGTNTIFYGGCYMEENKTIRNNIQNKWSWVRGTICHQCIFYPKSIYKTYQYNLKYKINADYAYNLILWSNTTFQHINVIVSFFNAGGISEKSNIDLPFRQDLPLMIKQQCGYLPYLYKQIRLAMGRIFRHRPF